jgi:PleD family two-component response regulator
MKAYELLGKILSSQQIEVACLDLAEIPIGSNVKVIVLVEDDDSESPAESFRQGWADVVAGNTIPASQLWE